MRPEDAWKAVLGELRGVLPKEDFDAWVRDARPLEFTGDTLVVGVLNEYARQWLQDRVAAHARQALEGITGRPARVRFVVMEGEPAAEEPAPDTLEIRAEEYDTVYERVVLPHRAVVLPGYFRRWIRVLGPDLAWMYVAFRQAAYMAGGRGGEQYGRFSGRQIARLCGISQRTFWRRVRNPDTWTNLDGLVHREGEAEWVGGAEPRRRARRYSVAMTLPLTPGDALWLREWLIGHVEDFGGPEGVLRAAAEADLKDIFPTPRDAEGPARTVRQVVHELFGDQLAGDTLEALASAIQDRIMPHNRDTIHISLFFLEHILPHLGAGPGWLVVLLRDLCWVDREKGEIRNRVIARWGYAGMGSWLSVRPKTVWEWLRKNPVLSVYVREVAGEEKALDFIRAPRVLDVLLEDVPREIVDAAMRGRDAGDMEVIGLAQGRNPARARFARALAETVVSGWREQHGNPGHSAVDTMEVQQLSQDHSVVGTMEVQQLSQDHSVVGTMEVQRLSQDRSVKSL